MAPQARHFFAFWASHSTRRNRCDFPSQLVRAPDPNRKDPNPPRSNFDMNKTRGENMNTIDRIRQNKNSVGAKLLAECEDQSSIYLIGSFGSWGSLLGCAVFSRMPKKADASFVCLERRWPRESFAQTARSFRIAYQARKPASRPDWRGRRSRLRRRIVAQDRTLQQTSFEFGRCAFARRAIAPLICRGALRLRGGREGRYQEEQIQRTGRRYRTR
jgi:hypothetical protein